MRTYIKQVALVYRKINLATRKMHKRTLLTCHAKSLYKEFNIFY